MISHDSDGVLAPIKAALDQAVAASEASFGTRVVKVPFAEWDALVRAIDAPLPGERRHA